MATEVMPAVGMSLELTEEQRFIQQTARKFAQDKIAKAAAEFDESGEFPFDTIKEMGKLGLMGIEVPEEYGGAGMDTIAYVLAETEISKADASHGTIMSVGLHQTDANQVYIGARYQGEIFGTQDGGETWTAMPLPGPVKDIYCVACG